MRAPQYRVVLVTFSKQALKNKSIFSSVLVISEFHVITTGMDTGGNCGLRH